MAHVKIGTEDLNLKAGAILVTTGFESYQPEEGNFGYKVHPGVITLPEFRELIDNSENSLIYDNRKIKSVAYIYCVGIRQAKRRKQILLQGLLYHCHSQFIDRS